jgi:hypothetical protein
VRRPQYDMALPLYAPWMSLDATNSSIRAASLSFSVVRLILGSLAIVDIPGCSDCAERFHVQKRQKSRGDLHEVVRRLLVRLIVINFRRLDFEPNDLPNHLGLGADTIAFLLTSFFVDSRVV